MGLKIRSVELLTLDQVSNLRELSDDGSVLLVPLHFRVLEVFDEVGETLEAGVGDVADLFAFKPRPSLALELFVEDSQVVRCEEVNEPVAYVALVLDVARQVEKIVSVGQQQIDFISQVHDGVLVGDVPDHDGGARVCGDLPFTDLEAVVPLVHSAAIEVILDVGVVHVIIWVHVRGACVTLVERVVDQKSAPKFGAFTGLLLLTASLASLLILLPFAGESFVLDFVQNGIQVALYDFLALSLDDNSGNAMFVWRVFDGSFDFGGVVPVFGGTG